jgi:RNase P/RNase MRP subunit POP5
MNLYNRTCKEMGLFLIRFDGITGIIKCNHIEKDNAINLLKNIRNIGLFKIEIETLGTSGSIKSLIKKHLSRVISLN